MITIRQAVESDVMAIYRLGQDVPEFSVNHATINFWPPDIIKEIIHSDEAILLIVEKDLRICGFIIANCNQAFKKVIIENIYVSPDVRNSRIGEQLLSHLLALVEKYGYEYIATLIPVDAQGASKLYTNSGFAKGEVFQWLDKSLSSKFRSK